MNTLTLWQRTIGLAPMLQSILIGCLGFCSVNPVRPYAVNEIARCAKDPNLHTGLKLHFGNSDVDVDNPEHLAQVRRVSRAANEQRMAIAVHTHANIDHHRPYGAKEARVFLEQLLPEAPDVTVQIAHLAGGGATMTRQSMKPFQFS
jgi:hypothetical protein